MADELPDRIGVVGGGRMGAGIAHAFLLTGATVNLIEVDAERAATARRRVERAVAESVRRGSTEESATQILSRLSLSSDHTALSDAGLVVEAVFESPTIKNDVLSAISAVTAPDTIIASNTSSMSISELAESVDGPERFIGMHFFNPVPASDLVEVVVGDSTSDDTVARVHTVVAALGKVAVTVSDSPGFASSRLGVLLGLEAIRMVEEGVASAEDIDAAMTLGYRHPIGPLKLTDLVGLDVRLDIAEYLASALGKRFEPPQLMREKVARGELGRKSGQGFYSWPMPTPTPTPTHTTAQTTTRPPTHPPSQTPPHTPPQTGASS